MKEINWTKIGAITTAVGVIIAAIIGWDELQKFFFLIGYQWTVLIIILFVTLTISAFRYQKIVNTLKLKPRLVVAVRDINCYVDTSRVNKGPSVGTVHVTKWWIEMTIKIQNKGWAAATNAQGNIEFTLGNGDDAIIFKSSGGRKFSLGKGEILPNKLRFSDIELTQKEFNIYPNGVYRLEYIYSCDQYPFKRKSVVRGRLTKADWIGDPTSLRIIQQVGFYG